MEPFFRRLRTPKSVHGKNSQGVKEGAEPHLPKKRSRKTFSGTSSPKSMHGKGANKLLDKDVHAGYAKHIPW